MKRNSSILIMISLVMFVLVGCGNSKEPDLLLNNYIKNIKELDLEGLDEKEYSQNEEKSSEKILEDEVTNELIEILKPYASKTKHKIKDIDVDGNKAMAVVEFEYIDLSLATENVMRNYMQEVMNIALSEGNSDMSDEELESLLVESFKNNIEATTSAYGEQYTDTELIIEMIKVDDVWYIDDPSEALLNVITLNVMATMDMDDAFEDSDQKELSREFSIGEEFESGPNLVTVDSIEKTSDHDILVEFTWTNNSEETKSFIGAVNVFAFQDGQELDGEGIVDHSEEYEGQDPDEKNLRPGASIGGTQRAFKPISEGPIEIEINSNMDNYSDEFDPANEPAVIKVELPK